VEPTTVVLIVAVLQLPLTPFVEVVGKAGAVLLRHNGPIGSKVGVSMGVRVTIMASVAEVKGPLPSGSAPVSVKVTVPAAISAAVIVYVVLADVASAKVPLPVVVQSTLGAFVEVPLNVMVV